MRTPALSTTRRSACTLIAERAEIVRAWGSRTLLGAASDDSRKSVHDATGEARLALRGVTRGFDSMVLTHVERVLRKYCSPSEHRFGEDPVSFDFECCRECGRRQRIDGTTCILCDADGAERVAIKHEGSGAMTSGQLCEACSSELAFRGAVYGWAVRTAQAA